jgi:tetratricopeptide (TPR) repeat protein
MTTFQRGVIEVKLQTMESGKFQSFILKILPILDPKYSGIIRHGQTEFDKTRPGTPDLLKTLENGDQIACECGTEENYWTPTENLADWKPVKDGEKCLHSLSQPIEIVLASNRPISIKHPNAKTILYDHFQKISGTKITVLTSADLATWAENNLHDSQVFEVASEFFPEVTENISLRKEKDVLSSVVDIGEKYGFPLQSILDVVRTSNPKDDKALQERIASELLGEDKRFIHFLPEHFTGIKRCEVHAKSLLSPHGRVIQLLGAPKIGKTTLCWETIDSKAYEYRWFSVPSDERLGETFVDALLFSVFSRHLSMTDALAKVRGLQTQSDTNGVQRGKILIIVDNAHLLAPSNLRRIDAALREQKTNGNAANLGVVFVTNRGLNAIVTSIAETIVAPPWSAVEIRELVHGKVQTKDNSQEYFNLLQSQSCGHPLLALALAGKYPDRSTLIENVIRGPSHEDIDLSAELKSVLYQDILPASDQQNFVQRLALLNGKSDSPVLEALRTQVVPVINTTVHNLYEQIGPAVLEGNLKEGLTVSITFKDIAKKRVDKTEMTAVYKAVSKELLKTKDKIIQAERYINGIYYLVLAGESGHAAARTLFLLACLKRDDEEKKEKVRRIVDDLFFLRIIDPKISDIDYINLSAVWITLGHLHISLGEFDEGSGYLEKINLERLILAGKDSKKNDLEQMVGYLISGAITLRMLAIGGSKHPSRVILDYLDHYRNGNSNIVPLPDLDSIFSELIWRLPDQKISSLEFADIATRLFPTRISDISNIAISLGVKAVKSSSIRRALEKIDATRSEGSSLFRMLAMASIAMHEDRFDEAKSHALQAQKAVADNELVPDLLGATFFQHLGDILFGCGNFSEAIRSFEKSCQLDPKGKDVLHGWNLYKIGLASSKDSEIVTSLRMATDRFLKFGEYGAASRAMGALGAYHLGKREYENAIQTACTLAIWYHKEKRLGAGTGLRMLLAQCIAVTHELTGEPLPGVTDDFPKAERRIYLKLSDSLRPQTGAAPTYQVVSQLARAAELKDTHRRLLKLGVLSDAESELDISALSTLWYTLFELAEPADIDEDEIAKILTNLCQYQPAPGDRRESFFMQSIFKPFEDKAKAQTHPWAPVLKKLTEIAGRVTRSMDPNLASRWNPYLDYQEGVAQDLLGQKSESYKLMRRAAQRALIDKNWALGYEAAFAASFKLWEHHPSLGDAGRANFEMFLCCEGLGLSAELVENLGTNMYRFWSASNWRRLKESDFKVKEYLSNSAQDLRRTNFSEQEAGPIMVSLLIAAFSHDRLHRDRLIFSKPLPPEIEARLK